MTVSKYIAEELFRLGVFHVFGYQGANITYLVDAVSTHAGLRYVQTYHEQGASFAANGYAQACGTLGVAVASSGPGALNLVTGIANAYCDSIPNLFICGDLSRRYHKNTLPLRQDGFQSTDIVSIVRPITKYVELVSSPEDVRYCLERAVFEATNARRGPALLSIPHWIQRTEIDPSTQRGFVAPDPAAAPHSEPISQEILDLLSSSRRPLLLLGGGCASTETRCVLTAFLERNPLPAVASLCGLSAISHDHPSYVGFIGDYGHRHANVALAASDCLIVLGSRMDERQIGFSKGFSDNKAIIHVDIDQSELLFASERYFPVRRPVADFLRHLDSVAPLSLAEWQKALRQLQSKYPVRTTTDELSPSSFLAELFGLLAPNAQVYVDVGLHQMYTAQFGVLTNGKQLYFSGGLGSMGYALPACIGGRLARPERQTLCIAGDGGFMMSLPELQTIARERLDVKIVILNNHCLGMVRNHQRAALDGRHFGTVEGYLAGDMNKIAQAFDLKFFRINEQSDVNSLDHILRTPGPLLVEVVFPNDMMPFPASVDYPLDVDVLSLQALTNVADE
ncbi:thiamine pyrophosphate-binding protein [uncultured Thiodictyon sp.]|uniref:thiamine pyrophosphate-binding protein n=1 Tax=uncultured Thiodictyon sp. TaxID=1846217 RepID=UPI0025CEBCD0|nr:thiamine pyrophosphate-binding protein [uncultured Thiodictyon sp.]